MSDSYRKTTSHYLAQAKELFARLRSKGGGLQNTKIYLFGSFARKDWVSSSDFDVALDCQGSAIPASVREQITNAWSASNIPFRKAILEESIEWTA